MFGKRSLHRFGMFFPKQGRAYDGGEKESDGSTEDVSHAYTSAYIALLPQQSSYFLFPTLH